MLLTKLHDLSRWPGRLARNDSGVTAIELAFTNSFPSKESVSIGKIIPLTDISD